MNLKENSAAATDNVRVARVDFFIDGLLTCQDLIAPYTCAWNVPNAANRLYSLQAKAYDAHGNIGSSSVVSVTSR